MGLNGLDSGLILGAATSAFTVGFGKNLEVLPDLCGSISPELSESSESNEPDSPPRKDNEPKSELSNEDRDSEEEDSPNEDIGPVLEVMLNILVGSPGFLRIRMVSSCGSAVEYAIEPKAGLVISSSGAAELNGLNALDVNGDAAGGAATGFSGSVFSEAAGLKGL